MFSPIGFSADLQDLSGTDRDMIEAQIQILANARKLESPIKTHDTMQVIERMAESRGIPLEEFVTTELGRTLYFQYFVEKHKKIISYTVFLSIGSLIYFGILFYAYRRLMLLDNITYSYNEDTKTRSKTVTYNNIRDNDPHLVFMLLFLAGSLVCIVTFIVMMGN